MLPWVAVLTDFAVLLGGSLRAPSDLRVESTYGSWSGLFRLVSINLEPNSNTEVGVVL